MSDKAASKNLVLCADDYAVNAPTSQGIVALCVLGRLSATSVMVRSPRWAEDAPALREMRERIDVGLHLDWTSAFAQAAGHGQGLGAVMLRSVLGGFRPHAVREEIERQLDAFEAHWQAPPDHVDGHQHVQQFAGLREVLCEVMQRRYGRQAQRPWLRVSAVAQAGLKARVISAMGAQALAHWATQHQWPCVTPLLGAYGFDGDVARYRQHMQQWLGVAPASVQPALLMCHPAASAQADDEIGPARAREFAYLASHDFVQDLLDAQVRLVRGSAQPMTPP